MTPDAVAVDASVAAKWVLTSEDLVVEARALFADSTAAGRRIYGPPHLHGEVGNAFYQRVRSQDPTKRLTPDEGEEALRVYLAMPIELVTPHGLYEQAFAFGQQFVLPSLYDAYYVAMARLLAIDLWTADRRLLDALGGGAPWVRFIGDYQNR